MAKPDKPDHPAGSDDLGWGDGLGVGGPINDNASRVPTPEGFFGAETPAGSPVVPLGDVGSDASVEAGPAPGPVLGTLPTEPDDAPSEAPAAQSGEHPTPSEPPPQQAAEAEQPPAPPVSGPPVSDPPVSDPPAAAATRVGPASDPVPAERGSSDAPKLDISYPPAGESGGSGRPPRDRPLSRTVIGLAPPADMDVLIDQEITKVRPSPYFESSDAKPPERHERPGLPGQQGRAATPSGLPPTATGEVERDVDGLDDMITVAGGVVSPAPSAPASVQPASVRPASVRPASVRPASVRPASVQPESVQPASVQPASVRPASPGSAPPLRAGLAPPREPRPEPLLLSDDELPITFDPAPVSDAPPISGVPSALPPSAMSGSLAPVSGAPAQSSAPAQSAAPVSGAPAQSSAPAQSAAPAQSTRRSPWWLLLAAAVVLCLGAVGYIASQGHLATLREGRWREVVALVAPGGAGATPEQTSGEPPAADSLAANDLAPDVAAAGGVAAAGVAAAAAPGSDKAPGPMDQAGEADKAATTEPEAAGDSPNAPSASASAASANAVGPRRGSSSPASSRRAIRFARKARASGDYGAAEEALTAALAREPRDHHIKHALAQTRLAAGRPGEAEALTRAIVKKRPRRVSYRLLLGDVLWAVGEEQEAIGAWKKVLRMDPGNDQATRRLRTHRAL